MGPGVALDTLLVADVLDQQRIDPRPIPPLYLPHVSAYLAMSPRYSTSSVSTLGSPRYDEDGCWSRVDRRACSVLLLALLLLMAYAVGLKAHALLGLGLGLGLGLALGLG